ncbi:MAG: protein kinase [Planctomycetota bacterium]|nr:protein kinase [Planctomycetota bacterium]
MPDFSFCPQCNTKYRTSGMPAFKRLRCKKCQGIFVVPEDSAEQSLAVAPERKPGAAQPDKDAENAIPAAIGDSSVLGRANFKGGVTLDGSPLPATDDGSASQDTMEGLPRSVEKKIEAAIKPAATDEKYIVEGEIARGGMGVILKAADRDIRRPVAMKVMLDAKSPKDKARFVEEAQVTGQLEHPNIVPIHELGIDAEGRLFFMMKLVKGKSLGDVLKALKKNDSKAEQDYPLGRLLNAFINICNAMAFAHAKGVVHRDLKPANIMLGDYGEVLVMDWGLAKPGAARIRASGSSSGVKVGEAEQSEEDGGVDSDSRDRELAEAVKSLRQETGGELTMDGTIIGTPHYMPPEQADGKIEEIDARSDIYSLGAMLYEILTLKTPCEGKGIFVLIKNVSEGNITPPDQRAPKRNIPKELSAITMKALARRKEDRYQRVEDLRRDIELFIEGRAVSAKQDTFAESVVKLVKRNKGVSMATAAAFLIVMAVVAVGYWLNARERGKAEKALEDFRTEQQKRETAEANGRADRKRSAPSFLQVAERAVLSRKYDEALAQANASVLFDPELPEARMLKAQLLIVRMEYAGAAVELDEYLKLKPGDADAAELRCLCILGRVEETVALATAFRDIFTRQKAYALASAKAQDKDKLFELVKRRIKEQWPTAKLGTSNDGSIWLSVNNIRTVNDLSPLRGFPLCQLDISDTAAQSLAPLEGMPLKRLDAWRCTGIWDLTPLKGMLLDVLIINGTNVSDLGPLRGMPLTVLGISGTRVTDLTPIVGIQLREVSIGGLRVRDLTALKGMPLENLVMCNCDVADLAPLSGMPLEALHIGVTPVRDLSPLKGMPLKRLTAHDTQVSDLTPLKGLPLTELNLGSCSGVSDLSSLEGAPLADLTVGNTSVHDLAPLKDMHLKVLYIDTTRVNDLTPLAGMQLQDMSFTPKSINKGMGVIREMKSLVTIGVDSDKKKWPAAEFWRRYDAGEFK